MVSLSLNELAELLLVASLAETEEIGHMNFFISVTEVAANLGIMDQNQIIDACHLLEEKGCFLLAFDHATALSASITPQGEAYVASGGETGIIGEYQRYRAARLSGNMPGIEFEGPDQPAPDSKISQPADSAPSQPFPGTAPDPTPHAASPGVTREDVSHIIASLEMLISNDASLSAADKSDLIVDLKSLALQASRNTPRKAILDAIASDLRKLPVFAALVDLLLAKT
jgi:hypothetical protein